jgi:putative membrane protein
VRRGLALAAAALPAVARAHEAGHAPGAAEALRAWSFDPWIVGPLALTAALYLRGAARMRAAAREGTTAAPSRGARAAYWGGVAAIAVALVSPVDRLSERLFSVHMGQHELLMLVAAPLLVLARPLGPLLLGLPRRARSRVLAVGTTRGFRASWSFLTAPVVALLVHAAVRWVWHLPPLFEGALAHRGVHAFQHLTFLVTAGLFWWSVVHGRYGKAGYGIAVLAVFVTAAHTGLLGAIIALARAPFYATYDAEARAMGVDPLSDQQVAGLVMWVPAGVLLTCVGLALFAAWLGEVARRDARRRA